MRRRYFALSLLAMLLIALNLRAPITAVGAIAHEVQAAWQLGDAAFGALGALPLICFFIFALAAPFFARTKAIILALLLLCAALALRPAAGTVALFAGTAGVGAAIAVLNVMMPSFIKRNFSARVPQMMALYSLSLSLSSLVGVFGHYLVGFLGARGVLAMWLILALAALFVYLPFTTAGRWKRSYSTFSAREFALMFKNRRAWAITAFMGLQSCVFYTVINWYFLVLKSRLNSDIAAANIVVIFQIAAIFTAYFVPIYIARARERMQRFGLHAICACNVIAVIVLLSGVPSLALLVASGLLFAVPVGGVFGVALGMIATKARTASATVYLSAMAQSVGYLLAAFGPWIFGLLSSSAAGKSAASSAANGAASAANGDYFYSLIFLLAVGAILWVFALICAKIREI